jgi:hypothetical protein
MYLRQSNSNTVHLVDEIKDAAFEDLLPEPPVPEPDAQIPPEPPPEATIS